MFMNPEDVSRAGKVTHRQGSSSLHGGWAGAGGTPREREPGLRWAGAQSRDIGSWRGMGWRTERTRRSSNCTTGALAPDRPSVCSWTQCPWGRDMCEVAPREGHSQCGGWKVQCLWTGARELRRGRRTWMEGRPHRCHLGAASLPVTPTTQERVADSVSPGPRAGAGCTGGSASQGCSLVGGALGQVHTAPPEASERRGVSWPPAPPGRHRSPHSGPGPCHAPAEPGRAPTPGLGQCGCALGTGGAAPAARDEARCARRPRLTSLWRD